MSIQIRTNTDSRKQNIHTSDSPLYPALPASTEHPHQDPWQGVIESAITLEGPIKPNDVPSWKEKIAHSIILALLNNVDINPASTYSLCLGYLNHIKGSMTSYPSLSIGIGPQWKQRGQFKFFSLTPSLLLGAKGGIRELRDSLLLTGVGCRYSYNK